MTDRISDGRAGAKTVPSEVFDAALPTLLLCRKAGGVIPGVGAALDAVRSSQKPVAVILAGDASERTKKQVCDKCAFYSVPLYLADVTAERLGSLFGIRSACAAAAVTRKGPSGSFIQKLG